MEKVKISDAEDIFRTIDTQREYLGLWLPFVAFTKEITDTENFLKSVVENEEQKQNYTFCIRKSGKFIGLVGFLNTDLINKKTEIGYWISENFQKQGIVTKSVHKLCDFAFTEMQMNRVQIRCATRNIPSKNIPKRLNFTFEGIERQGEQSSNGDFNDLEVYSLLKNEFN